VKLLLPALREEGRDEEQEPKGRDRTVLEKTPKRRRQSWRRKEVGEKASA